MILQMLLFTSAQAVHLLISEPSPPLPQLPPHTQAFASGNNEAGDDTIVSQLRSKRNMLGDFIAAKDVQVRGQHSGAAVIACKQLWLHVTS
jgi:hypothetical protein